MLKKISLAIAAAGFVTGSGFAVAESVDTPVGKLDVSMNVTLASDYIYRGISQTLGDGAIQGGLDVVHESGLYTGIWASNVDFGGDASEEFDYYVGFGNNITDDIAYDLGWVKYEYPGQSSLNYSEYYGSLTAYGFKVGANYSNDFQIAGDDNTTLYTYIGYEYTLPYEIGLALQYGKYDFKDDYFFSSSGNAEDSYNDWSVGLTKEFVGLEFGLTYTDTNLTDDECLGYFGGVGKDDYCGANFVVSVSKTL